MLVAPLALHALCLLRMRCTRSTLCQRRCGHVGTDIWTRLPVGRPFFFWLPLLEGDILPPAEQNQLCHGRRLNTFPPGAAPVCLAPTGGGHPRY